MQLKGCVLFVGLMASWPQVAKGAEDQEPLATFGQLLSHPQVEHFLAQSADTSQDGKTPVLEHGLTFVEFAGYLDAFVTAGLRGRSSIEQAQTDPYVKKGLSSFHGMFDAEPMLSRVLEVAALARGGRPQGHWGYLTLYPKRFADAGLLHHVFVGFIAHRGSQPPHAPTVEFIGLEACRRASIRKALLGQAHYFKPLKTELTSGTYLGQTIYPKTVTTNLSHLLENRPNAMTLHPVDPTLNLTVCANTTLFVREGKKKPPSVKPATMFRTR